MMKLHVLAVVVVLATCVSAGLFSKNKGVIPGPPVFCPSLPLPTMTTSDFLTKMTSFLDEAAGKIQGALDEDKSPGGVAMSVVYRNVTIWTKGFGMVDMAGRMSHNIESHNHDRQFTLTHMHSHMHTHTHIRSQ